MPPDPAETLTLSSRRVVLPHCEQSATLRIISGHVASIDPYDPAQGEDLGHLAILPGLVDSHVHFNDPGRADWEGLASGTAAAAAGGVTLAVDMPLNSLPVTTNVEALEMKRRASDALSCDVGYYAGVIPGNEQHIPALIEAGVLGAKAFLCDSGIPEFPAATEKELRAVMPMLAEANLPLLVHCELVSDSIPLANPLKYSDYLASRPPKFEQEAIRQVIQLCRETGCPTHIVHLADVDSLSMIRDAREEGLPLTVETCPHYLFFTAEEIPDGACQYKCAPPIREMMHREKLWQALADGTLDLIASDHSPCPPELKRLDEGRFDQAWGGISSVQLTLPIVWTEASRRGHSLEDVMRWLSVGPAKLVRRPHGIRVGGEANLVLFDPEAEFTVRGDKLEHRHRLTPYEGRKLRGVVKQTYLRGKPAASGEGRAL